MGRNGVIIDFTPRDYYHRVGMSILRVDIGKPWERGFFLPHHCLLRFFSVIKESQKYVRRVRKNKAHPQIKGLCFKKNDHGCR